MQGTQAPVQVPALTKRVAARCEEEMKRRLQPLAVPVAVAVALSLGAFLLPSPGAAAPAASADLKVTKTDAPDPVAENGQLTYTIRVENLGPGPATGVTATDRIPNDVDVVSVSGPGGCTTQAGRLVCPLDSLAPVGVDYGGSAATVTIVVGPRRTGTLRNTVTVRGDQHDPAKGNNRAVATTTVLAPPTCRGRPATVSGSFGDDVLYGTSGPDVIVALAGNDRIVSRAGRDLICAGAGSDRVRAGSAADHVLAGPGRDRVIGGGGPDVLRGAAGNDVLFGNRGADRLRGGRGFDRCRGGPGADSVRGCER